MIQKGSWSRCAIPALLETSNSMIASNNGSDKACLDGYGFLESILVLKAFARNPLLQAARFVVFGRGARSFSHGRAHMSEANPEQCNAGYTVLLCPWLSSCSVIGAFRASSARKVDFRVPKRGFPGDCAAFRNHSQFKSAGQRVAAVSRRLLRTPESPLFLQNLLFQQSVHLPFAAEKNSSLCKTAGKRQT